MNSTTIVACLATAAVGMVLGVVIGATGFSVLASAATDSTNAKYADMKAKFDEQQYRLERYAKSDWKQSQLIDQIKKQHPQIVTDAENELLAPSF